MIREFVFGAALILYKPVEHSSGVQTQLTVQAPVGDTGIAERCNATEAIYFIFL
jgi:hypothetical protein